MLGSSVSRQIFLNAAAGADLSIIEGMMVLFDGSPPTNESHAHKVFLLRSIYTIEGK
jgi:cobyrinic acid a,c-diamide synthase